MNDSSLPSVPSLSRRRLLQGGLAATLGLPSLGLLAQEREPRELFSLGVASGMPTASGVVLWTRLLPSPQGADDSPFSGLPVEPIEVRWELAHDEGFRRIAARGELMAVAGEAHSARVELQGLDAGRDYFYRFIARGQRSPVGRTRTAPALGADASAPAAPLRLAFASCQQYEQGFYTAYRDMARQPLDFVVHLGDYIYESSWGARHVRKHRGGIPTQLHEFRDRYALYKSDPDLQAAHAAFPWLVTWDDHEVANDYTNDVSPHTSDPAQFLAMRAAAYQAWWEHMPVPRAMKPQGPDMRIYGSHRFGSMLDLSMLDARQYRSHHACLDGRRSAPLSDCAERREPGRTFLGREQEAWFAQQMARPAARWTLVAQSTLMAEADRKPGAEHGYWMDGWDGYPAARDRLLDALATHRPRNALVISGDVHAFWAADLRRTPDTAPMATEFVSGAITSQGPGPATVAAMQAKNPHLRFGRADKRGYALMTLDTRGCEVELRAVDDEKQVDSKVARLARFNVADGQAGVNIEAS